MLAKLPREIVSQILDLLPTKQRLQLMLVCKAWKDISRVNNSWHSIGITATDVQLPSALMWLTSLTRRSTKSTSSIDIIQSPPGLVDEYVFRIRADPFLHFRCLTRVQLGNPTAIDSAIVLDDALVTALANLQLLEVLVLGFELNEQHEEGYEDWIESPITLPYFSLYQLAALTKLRSLSCCLHRKPADDNDDTNRTFAVALAPEFTSLTSLTALALVGYDMMLAANTSFRDCVTRLHSLEVQNLFSSEELITAPVLQHYSHEIDDWSVAHFRPGTIVSPDSLLSCSIAAPFSERPSCMPSGIPHGLTKLDLRKLTRSGTDEEVFNTISYPNLLELNVASFDVTAYGTYDLLAPFDFAASRLVSISSVGVTYGAQPYAITNYDDKWLNLKKLIVSGLDDAFIDLGDIRSFPRLEELSISDACLKGPLESATLRSLEARCIPAIYSWSDMAQAAAEIFAHLPSLKSVKLHLQDCTLKEVEAIVQRLSLLPSLQDLKLEYRSHNLTEPHATNGQGFIETCCWALKDVQLLHCLELECVHDRVVLHRIGLPPSIRLRLICKGWRALSGYGIHLATKDFQQHHDHTVCAPWETND